MKDCTPWVGAHAGAGEQHEEEGSAEAKFYELTPAPIPHVSVPLGVGRWKGQA